MIKPIEFIHPEDAAALRKLESIPGLESISKKFLKYGYEKMYYGHNMASTIRLSPTQLPQIYKHLPPICDRLEMEEPEFYLEMNPIPNAYTFGDTYKYICVTSGLLEMMDDEEIDAIIAHECGHIICRHSLYHTISKLLFTVGANTLLPGQISETILIALYYWQRKSELSCDRVAAVITSPDTVARVMARLAGGPQKITGNINMEEWALQADEYDKLYNDSGFWNRILQMSNTVYNDHPFAAVRVREILKWKETGQFLYAKQQLKDRTVHRCGNCGKIINEGSLYCEYCGSKQSNNGLLN